MKHQRKPGKNRRLPGGESAGLKHLPRIPLRQKSGLPPLRLWQRLLLYLLTAVFAALSVAEAALSCFPYALGILLYCLAAVSLTLSCCYFIRHIRRDIREVIKPAIAANPYTSRVAADYRLRTVLFTVPGTVSSILYAAFNGVLAAMGRSAWFAALAAYYLLLSLMRAGVVLQERRLAGIADEGKRMKKELAVYRRNSVLFLFMAAVLAGAVVLLEHSIGGKSYPGFTIYAAAAYFFYKIIMSTIQVIRVKKRGSPLLTIARRIGHIDACVSILTLQTAMFASFYGGEKFIRLMNAVTGTGVCLIVLGLGIQGLCYGRGQDKKRKTTG